jgi:transcriptional regulator with XRE-family HTH domain
MGTLVDGLKPAREAAGLTQQELATALGWNGSGAHAHVGRVERGERSTTVEYVERWYEICGSRLLVLSTHTSDDAAAAAVAASGRMDLLVRLARVIPRMDEHALARLDADVEFLERRFGR